MGGRTKAELEEENAALREILADVCPESIADLYDDDDDDDEDDDDDDDD